MTTRVVLPLAPSMYISVPLSTEKLPTPNAPAAAVEVADAGVAAAGDDGAPNSQFACPFASVSRTMTGSVSLTSTTSNRRDNNGNGATCASMRLARTMSATLLPAALLNVTSEKTTFGSSDSLRSIGPLIARSRPVAALTRACTGPISVWRSTVATAIAAAIRTSAVMPPAAARMIRAVRRMRRFYAAARAASRGPRRSA